MEIEKKYDLSFYNKKKVFITGHTGFKGSWLCKMLTMYGADVMGYALEPPTNPSLFLLTDVSNNIISVIDDVRNREHLETAILEYQPEIVLHLAAQPLVRESYKNPVNTYETNVMGTVNILEAVRKCKSVKSFLNVTTDKVYFNHECANGYIETDPLDGYDPYSNSKSCSELITHSYQRSFFSEPKHNVAISTVRAGNVIGGGDFASDRIIPDCVRAALESKEIIVRNPHSIRPYQHVLEPLYAYLMIAAYQCQNVNYSGCYNVGPDETDCCETGKLVGMFTSLWGEGLRWVNKSEDGPHEANFLKLDCTKIKTVFGWSPRWDLKQAIAMTVEWTKCWQKGENINVCMERQIEDFLSARR